VKSKKLDEPQLAETNSSCAKEKAMKSKTGSTTIWTLLGVFGVLLVVASLLPPFAEGQQGNNAVYKNATTCCQESGSFIDAFVFAQTGVDFCKILNGGLAQPLRLNSPYMHHQKAAAPLVAVFDEWARGTFQCCSMVTDNT
jgi:hypothetical protein